MNKVKWGMIVAGDVTKVKSGPAFHKVENSEIHYVMRRNLDKAEDYANRHNIPNFTNDADHILNNSEIDAVYISTPPSTHAYYTIKAANAKKHVYVEKPMAVNYKECKEMISACKKNGVHLFIAYYRRELDYFKKIKDLVDSNLIGKIKSVDIKLLLPPNKSDYDKDNQNWRVNPDIAGAGYFYDLASHQFDFLDYLLGPIKSASGYSTNQANLYNAEDAVSSSFIFESNILGSGNWCFSMGGNERLDKTVLYGDEGEISFSYFEPLPIRLKNKNGEEYFEIGYPQHVQQPLISSAVKNILGIGNCVSTGESGARTNLVMDSILNKL